MKDNLPKTQGKPEETSDDCFLEKKVRYKSIKSSIWTPVLEIWSWTFDGVKDISWQSCEELAILDLNENWYLQNKCSAKNQRTSKIKRRSLLQIESVSWHHNFTIGCRSWRNHSSMEWTTWDDEERLGTEERRTARSIEKIILRRSQLRKDDFYKIWIHWRMP